MGSAEGAAEHGDRGTAAGLIAGRISKRTAYRNPNCFTPSALGVFSNRYLGLEDSAQVNSIWALRLSGAAGFHPLAHSPLRPFPSPLVVKD